MSRLSGWMEERTGLGAAVRSGLDERIPGGAKFWYVLGSAVLVDFALLVVTGIWQMVYYTPTVDHAYDSVNFIRLQVPFGWLIHGIHFWAATVMVVLVALHLAQVFIWGAFKKPREMTWLLGVGLMLFTLAAVFTGGPLLWDKAGYWVARVGNGIAGSIPWVGGFVQQLLWGGPSVGQSTLTHFFTLHVAIVPLIILALFGLHMMAFRKGGPAGPASGKTKPEGRFWPDQVLMDAVFASAVVVVIVGLAAFLLTPIRGAADPTDATYIARPEWEFLFFFQILKYLPGTLEAVGAVLVPLLLLVLLALVPWLDRGYERRPGKRPVAMGAFVVLIAVVAGLSLAAAQGSTEAVPPKAGAPEANVAAVAAVASSTAPAAAATAAYTVGSAAHGETIYLGYCLQCHGDLGRGGVPNPGSDDKVVPEVNPIDPAMKSKDPVTFALRLDEFLQDGSVPPGDSPKLAMPAFGKTDGLTQPQIADVEAYVMKLNGVDRARIVHAGIAPKPFFWGTLVAFLVGLAFSGFALLRRERE
jgi:ubiquinol-cytochrome c reductase cytochrome b subunit